MKKCSTDSNEIPVDDHVNFDIQKYFMDINNECFIVSASMMFFNLVLFFTMLKLDSPKQWPQMSWSAMLAATACMLELCGGLILMHGS